MPAKTLSCEPAMASGGPNEIGPIDPARGHHAARRGRSAYAGGATMTSTWAIIEIEVTRQCRTSFCLPAVAVIAATLGSGGSSAQEMTVSPEALRQIAQVEAEIDRIEAQTL